MLLWQPHFSSGRHPGSTIHGLMHLIIRPAHKGMSLIISDATHMISVSLADTALPVSLNLYGVGCLIKCCCFTLDP
jgi:hypothetical protein